MWKKVIAAVLLISLLTVAIVQAVNKQTKEPEPASQTAASQKGPAVGSMAPDFELKTLTGETVKLSNLKGKKVMLNFWATWCPPCKAEMPDMEKFHQEVGDEVTILAVNIDPQLDVQAFVDEYKITFPIPLDTEDAVNEEYKVLSIPTTYFIDSKGIMQHKFVGSMKYKDMKEQVGKLK
ncbi:peroxiredoxin [Neobacillus niacini]|uniref:peroxiredoxin family protein n=1 Tax=Neobacillus niacini TaxID=86668 RepID=UPI0021CAF7C3|nr:TlpA disulfide reductase family protein [Neobacillus niacini]MCM3764633.1 TlpA family protein disulfide reductase [Neobacillus niacini]